MTEQLTLLPTKRVRHRLSGYAGELLRAYDQRHRETLEGRRYMMHGGDMAACRRLEIAGYTVDQLTPLMDLYFDQMQQVRGTPAARYWPARFTAFQSRVADLVALTDANTGRQLTPEEITTINRAGIRGYLAGKAGETVNPFPAGTRTSAAWEKARRHAEREATT